MKKTKKLLAFALAAAMLLTLCACGGKSGKGDGVSNAGVAVANDPKAVAESYVEASIEGDIKTVMQLEPGKRQDMFEDGMTAEEKEEMFEGAEEDGNEVGLDLDINSFSDYYAAFKKITKAENDEYFGKYKVKVEVVETKDMRNSEIEKAQEKYSNEDYEGYVDPDKIAEGKKVYVRASIDGDKESVSVIMVVYVVKYGGKWKVAATGSDDRD